MKNQLFYFILFSIVLISCTKEGPVGPAGKDSLSDKQIRFDFGGISNIGVTSDTTYWSLSPLYQFNIKNFVGVDSVILVAYDINTTTNNYVDVINNVKIELYNLTDNAPIQNSEIVSDDILKGTFVSSKNMFSNLPTKPIDIELRIIFSKNQYAIASKVILFLYRK